MYAINLWIRTCLKSRLISVNPSFLILVTVLTLWFCSSAWAVNSNQWRIDHLQIDDGLPDSTVYSVAQDQSGFMWFGTTSGLARFDGYGFRSFKHDGADPESISNNNAGNIYIDSKNRVWIGTFGGGVNLLDINQEKLTRFPYSSTQYQVMVSENVQTFYEDENGSVWIGTATGLYRYDGKDMVYYASELAESDSNQSRVWDIEGGANDEVWLGTSVGLSKLTPSTGEFSHFKLPKELVIDITSNQFRTLLYDEGNLWIGSSSGLYSFNIQSGSFEYHSNGQQTIKINDLYQTPDGQMLLASMEGLYLYDLTSASYERDINGQLWQQLSHVDVRDIHVDVSGIMWLATRDNGVYKVDPAGGLFQHHNKYLPEAELNEKAKQVWSIVTDRDGTLYLGTSETVFRQESNGSYTRIVTAAMDKIPGFIRDIETSDDAGLWISGSTGLYFLERGETTAKQVTTPFDLVGMEPTDIFSLEFSADGEMWLALYNLGVLRWHPDNGEAELIQSYTGGNLTDSNITHIFADSRNNLWISSNLVGLFQFNAEDQQLRLYSHSFGDASSISSNRIKDVYEDSQGRLWVATPRGLNQYNYEDDSFDHINKSDGLINGVVNFILEDSSGNLWLGNRFGLSHYNPERGQVKNYYLNSAIRHDGMITRSATIDRDDVIWLGSANGYYTFNPKDHINTAQYNPPLVITGIKIDNRPINDMNLEYQQRQLTLKHGNRQVEIDFSVLDYKSPEQIRFVYRLPGLHDDWLDASITRHVDIKDLSPGNYELEIKASSHDGRWKEQRVNINIEVQPIWWERGWVRVMFIIAAIFLAVFFHLYRTYKIRQQNQKLEQEVNNRTTELKGLNEQLELAANSDYLTGLPNRMAFINAYEHMNQNPNISTTQSCVVMGDVDHFKSINDQYGHNVGDEVLIQVSTIMKQLIRAEDLIARWGGEEFIFYFANKDAQSTTVLIERIRQAIENSQIKCQDLDINVTMTFGVCQKTTEMSLIECINAADEAMYKGKAAGRNQVVVS